MRAMLSALRSGLRLRLSAGRWWSTWFADGSTWQAHAGGPPHAPAPAGAADARASAQRACELRKNPRAAARIRHSQCGGGDGDGAGGGGGNDRRVVVAPPAAAAAREHRLDGTGERCCRRRPAQGPSSGQLCDQRP